MIIFEYIDLILFALSVFTVAYLLLYAIAAMFSRGDKYAESRIKHRFAIIYPAYKDDEYILPSINSFLQQDYPIDCYDIIVVADHLLPETILKLSQLPIMLIEAKFKNSSKMKSVKVAMKQLNEGEYDIALIMNADNVAENDLLNDLNNTYASGSNAIQTHRIRKERTNNIAVLNAIADEINNSIFRTGHAILGLSASLNGSGMAFDFNWFKAHINKIDDDDDEKVIESLLLKERIYIEYLDNTHIYATRKEGKKNFYAQRRSWIRAQYSSLAANIGNLPKAIFSGNFDYADRILQWITFPRTLLLGIILLCGCASLYLNWVTSIKWWILLFVSLLTLAFATPNYLVDNKFNKAMKAIPLMAIGMIFNILLNPKKKSSQH